MGISLCQTREATSGLFCLILAIEIHLEGLWSCWYQCALPMHLDPILEQDQAAIALCSNLISTRGTKKCISLRSGSGDSWVTGMERVLQHTATSHLHLATPIAYLVISKANLDGNKIKVITVLQTVKRQCNQHVD